ncbi:MAG: hypothetical protein MJ078_07970, partial [Clostridia bacterium]|nr:hypothetical protein [Clostridia bacterium]
PKNVSYAILECGTNHKGELSYLSSVARPHFCFITCVGYAHIGAFLTREGIAKEKASIRQYAMPSAPLFYPRNESLLLPYLREGDVGVLPVPEEELSCPADISLRWAAGFVLAFGRYLGFSEEETAFVKDPTFLTPVRRKTVEKNKITYVNDAYNASPESMASALEYLMMQKARRHVMIAGDMLELGNRSDVIHRSMGRLMGQNADAVCFFGKNRNLYREGALAAGMNKDRIWMEEETEDFPSALLQNRLQAGDVVLCKAAHALRADISFSALYGDTVGK